jgi:CheY-like chemotaxis protein
MRMKKPLRLFLPRKTFARSATTEAPLIYAVDDAPELTELYTTLLGETGFIVRAFNDRADALAALRADRMKPDLLITDYFGRSIPVDGFMIRCLALYPTLRILMASGFSEMDVRLFQTRPNRFLQKPFTAEELRQEVIATLAA